MGKVAVVRMQKDESHNWCANSYKEVIVANLEGSEKEGQLA